METVKSFFAGWIGGAGLVIAGQPFDTIKTRLQANPTAYTGTLDCVKKTVAADGVSSLYAGAKPLILGIGPVFAIYFAVYDAAERAVRKYRNRPIGPMTIPEIALCGASTGLVGSFLLGPAELVKVRCQTTMQSPGAVIRSIIAAEGMGGFTRGMLATVIRDVPASAAWFGTFEVVKAAILAKQAPPHPVSDVTPTPSLTTMQALFAGGCAGVMNWVVCLPLDAVKTRQQAGGARVGWAGAARALASESGIRGFYRGAVPIFARAFPANAACFACKEAAVKLFNRISPPPAPVVDKDSMKKTKAAAAAGAVV